MGQPTILPVLEGLLDEAAAVVGDQSCQTSSKARFAVANHENEISDFLEKSFSPLGENFLRLVIQFPTPTASLARPHETALLAASPSSQPSLLIPMKSATANDSKPADGND